MTALATVPVRKVPFAPTLEGSADCAGLAELVLSLVKDVADSDEFILKSRVSALEAAVRELTGARHAIATASATGSLTLVLTALDLERDDEVITPAFSFVSTASTVALCGARPILADVEEHSLALDPTELERALSPRTRAVVPAYLFAGEPNMPAITELSRRAGITVIEDSAIALGATSAGRPAGRWGEVGVYSFFPAKPAGGIGDAGMVVTDDDELAHLMRMLRNHGQDLNERFLHHLVGFNCRMDEISAAFVLDKLPALPQLLDRRRALAHAYGEGLDGIEGVRLPTGPFDDRSVYTYVIRVPERDALRRHLAQAGVGTAVHYPRPLHLQPAFAHLGYREGDFPVAERVAAEVLTLPLYPSMTVDDVHHVCSSIARFHGTQA